MPDNFSPALVIWLHDLGLADVPSVGGKNASLGELVRALGAAGVRVPDGFATTAAAWRALVEINGIEGQIASHLEAWRAGRATLPDTGHAIRAMILNGKLPDDLVLQIRAAYDQLGERAGKSDPAVAVRSSATAEDLPGASFAGLHETFLNVRGAAALLDACLRCYASLFTDRAISYREAKGFDHLSVALSVGVQQMVRADLAGSGVMFTLDTETGFPRVVTITAAWGLGETIVQGAVNPDRYTLFKPLLSKAGVSPILDRTLGEKAVRMIYAGESSGDTRIVPSTLAERDSFVLSDPEILELSRWAIAAEQHYGRAMDLEWAKDGANGLLYLIQARPETVHASAVQSQVRRYRLKTQGTPLLKGVAVGTAIAAGPVCLIRDPTDIAGFRDGAILVTGNTDPDWVPVMKRAAGIVTDRGGSTSHAAIVSRELGVPAIVGTGTATATLQDGREIAISACGVSLSQALRADDELLTLRQVEALVKLKRSSIYTKMKEDGFPDNIRLGGRVVWRKGDVMAWVEEKAAQGKGSRG